jgi:hypothetical protein
VLLPRDFLDEVETELARARRTVEHDAAHVAALDELRRAAATTALRLGRPVTVFDVVRSAPDRDRMLALARRLRG